MSLVLVLSYTTSGPKSSYGSVGSGTGERWYFRLYRGGEVSTEASVSGDTGGGAEEMEDAPGGTGSEGGSFGLETFGRETNIGVHRKSTLTNFVLSV